ncbi:GNAT family N-acetyltransferase [Paenibacillus gansuensis]|uniref:GNAT family N-acetyltransferase n=1 Tax=Paenibacillus gansuensis TaxID=306542 RepID=A0ABW5PG13_9BACL
MLTEQQLRDIEQLQKKCEQHDGIQLKLNWDMLRNRESGGLDFFHYVQGELAAFLGLYPFGSKVEVCGMVLPGERRKGRFTHLFQQASERIRTNGYQKVLLNTPAGSYSGKALMEQLGAEYAFSEFQMEWRKKPLEDTEGVTLRQAGDADAELRIRLLVEGFGVDEQSANEVEFAVKRDADMITDWMIDAGGETVGKLRVILENEQAWIYGFVILPEWRGQGIGRKALQQVVKNLDAAGRSVHLEVEVRNEHALGLYKSVGFEAVHSQDYYSWK